MRLRHDVIGLPDVCGPVTADLQVRLRYVVIVPPDVCVQVTAIRKCAEGRRDRAARRVRPGHGRPASAPAVRRDRA
ncbi:hypothetical protein, partial [Herbidospora daliensis]|uniref:hypothetical protein n=1 Tax=Herbidospora daliensis TaxID=295585 RepID=UPI001E2D71E0